MQTFHREINLVDENKLKEKVYVWKLKNLITIIAFVLSWEWKKFIWLEEQEC